MEQKTKLLTLIVLVILIAAGSWYFAVRKDQTAQPENNSQIVMPELEPDQILPLAPVIPELEPGRKVSGEVQLINEKVISIRLENGNSFTTEMSSSTQVIIENITKPGAIVDLKAGQNITIELGAANKAVQILIKK